MPDAIIIPDKPIKPKPAPTLDEYIDILKVKAEQQFAEAFDTIDGAKLETMQVQGMGLEGAKNKLLNVYRGEKVKAARISAFEAAVAAWIAAGRPSEWLHCDSHSFILSVDE